jgi:WD40 repeat protein
MLVLPLSAKQTLLDRGIHHKTAAILEIDVAMKMCKGRLLNGHEGAVLTADFDEQVTVTGSFDKTLRIWETSTGRHLDTIVRNFPVKCIRLRHPLLLEGSGHTIGLWHLEEMRQIRQVNNGDWVTALDCDWNKRLVTSAAWSAKSHGERRGGRG